MNTSTPQIPEEVDAADTTQNGHVSTIRFVIFGVLLVIITIYTAVQFERVTSTKVSQDHVVSEERAQSTGSMDTLVGENDELPSGYTGTTSNLFFESLAPASEIEKLVQNEPGTRTYTEFVSGEGSAISEPPVSSDADPEAYKEFINKLSEGLTDN